MKVPPQDVSGLPPGWVVSHEVTFTTVDSGACDSIAPPPILVTQKHRNMRITAKRMVRVGERL